MYQLIHKFTIAFARRGPQPVADYSFGPVEMEVIGHDLIVSGRLLS